MGTRRDQAFGTAKCVGLTCHLHALHLPFLIPKRSENACCVVPQLSYKKGHKHTSLIACRLVPVDVPAKMMACCVDYVFAHASVHMCLCRDPLALVDGWSHVDFSPPWRSLFLG